MRTVFSYRESLEDRYLFPIDDFIEKISCKNQDFLQEIKLRELYILGERSILVSNKKFFQEK